MTVSPDELSRYLGCLESFSLQIRTYHSASPVVLRSTYRIAARTMAVTIVDISIIPFWKSHSLRCGESFWKPAGARSILRSTAIVQHHRPAVS
jgi:hypothetical protein